MSTLKELISSATWLELDPVLKRLYPDQYESSAEGYELVLERLRLMEPEDRNDDLVLVISEREDDGETWYEVTGWSESDQTHYSMSFTPWAMWLGMGIDADTLNATPAREVIVHLLWEMTWNGFSEEDQEEAAGKIKDALNEAMLAEAKAIDMDELQELIDKDQPQPEV